MKLNKYQGNPILSPNGNDWECRCVLNPGVVYDEEQKKFIMLYRAAGNDLAHIIRCGLAESKDGIHFERVSDDPIFQSSREEMDGGCVEDPRIVKMGELYYIAYASRAYAPGQYWIPGAACPCIGEDDVYDKDLPFLACTNHTASYLAVTKDFRHYKRLGRITHTKADNRDVIIFPEKVNGKYVILSRPKFPATEEVKMPSIWISYVDDLLDYYEAELLMTGEQWWETSRMGAGTPPIKTDKGWFMLYHGVDDEGFYRIGAVLLDLNNPSKILARTKNYIMEPEYDYETCGLYNGCVFPTGTVVLDDTLYVYYGTADKHIGLATAKFSELIDYLANNCKL